MYPSCSAFTQRSIEMCPYAKLLISVILLLYFDNLTGHEEIPSSFPVAIPLVNKNWKIPHRFSREAPEKDIFDTRTACAEKNASHPANRVDTSERVKSLRLAMAAMHFDAFIVPSEDEHQNEFVAPSEERRRFITGFSGSAGTAVITQSEQLLWTDQRYYLQAQQEMDCNWNLVVMSYKSPGPADWLASNLPSGAHVAADPRLFGAEQWEEMELKLNDSGIFLFDSGTILDDIWEEMGRPIQSHDPIFVHDIQYAGKTWEDKVRHIRRQLADTYSDLFVVTALDDAAWLLNLRGSDIPYNAVFRSYVVLDVDPSKPVHVFLHNPANITEEVKNHLRIGSCHPGEECVNIYPYEEIRNFLMVESQREDVLRVQLNKNHPYYAGISYYILSSIPEDKRYIELSPILLTKAKKDAVETANMKEAQTKDSVALIEFFAFLELEVAKGVKWDELSVTTPLRNFRKQQAHYRGDSFQPISCFGSNGALVHYSPTNETTAIITNQSLYLLDSGGQYLDGTTDITRTVHFGTPTKFMKEAYTRVLRGVIDLASFVFPQNTKDVFIDVLARRPLFEGGLDYGHGTGHGIGYFLNVHEGPTLIGMRETSVSTLEEGQFFSDEPGYYEDGEFGIRLENIVHVAPHPSFTDKYNRSMLTFDTVTLVPYEPKLIDVSLLEINECQLLNDYNKRIMEVIGPRLKKKGNTEAYQWMESRIQPIDCKAVGNLNRPAVSNAIGS